MGRLCGPHSQRGHNDSPSCPGWTRGCRARTHHGHLGSVHRSVRSCPGEGRPGHDGKPHRRIVAVPVRSGGPALPAAANIHPGCFRHRHHADSCDGHADRIRFADGRAGGHFSSCRAGSGPGYPGNRLSPRAARPASVEVMVARHRHSGGLCSVSLLRPVRRPADTGCAVGQRSSELVAGVRCKSGGRVLGPAARIRSGHPGGRHRDHWRRSSHPAGFPAQTAGHRFPGRAGSSQRRRRGKPAVRHHRHPAQHDLLIQHFPR